MLTSEQKVILDRLDGLYAWDSGCLDSGIKDDTFKASVVKRDDIDILLLALVKQYSESPRTIEDVVTVVRWIQDDLGVDWL